MQLPTIGGYEIVGLLGTGGMAQVLLGRQTGPNGFERPVVVKRILPHLVRRQSFVDMFLDEARTIASIRHPNVVSIHDFRHEDGELFMVMEYLEGETVASLRRRLNARDERMPMALWCHIFAETCAGLHAAHQATNEIGLPLNLVHRDVSPPNILVTYDGAVKLIDFGIAKSDHRSSQTDAGHIKGKYAYMSPEQAEGKALDARSDVFSLGIVVFEMTTGKRLFKRDTDLLTVQAVCNDLIPEPNDDWPEYTEDLHKICSRALCRDPSERYQSALEMRRDLLALVRADDSAPLPEELIGLFMQDIFEDRIDLKRGLLHRVRMGERFDTVSSPTDSVIAVSTLMTGALPRDSRDGGPSSLSLDLMPQEPAVTVDESTEPPPRAAIPPPDYRTWAAVGIIGFAAGIGLLAIGLSGGAPTPPPPPPPVVTVAPPPVVPAFVTLEFASEPLGATVRIQGEVVGQTPLSIPWPRSEAPVELTLDADGYDAWATKLTPSRDVLVKGNLTKTRRRRKAGRIRRLKARRSADREAERLDAARLSPRARAVLDRRAASTASTASAAPERRWKALPNRRRARAATSATSTRSIGQSGVRTTTAAIARRAMRKAKASPPPTKSAPKKKPPASASPSPADSTATSTSVEPQETAPRFDGNRGGGGSTS